VLSELVSDNTTHALIVTKAANQRHLVSRQGCCELSVNPPGSWRRL